jgi:hypothetical protein
MRFFLISCLFGVSVGVLRFASHDWSAGILPVVQERALPLIDSQVPFEHIASSETIMAQTTEVSLQR